MIIFADNLVNSSLADANEAVTGLPRGDDGLLFDNLQAVSHDMQRPSVMNLELSTDSDRGDFFNVGIRMNRPEPGPFGTIGRGHDL